MEEFEINESELLSGLTIDNEYQVIYMSDIESQQAYLIEDVIGIILWYDWLH